MKVSARMGVKRLNAQHLREEFFLAFILFQSDLSIMLAVNAGSVVAIAAL
jgi:hypothetical protein